MEMEWHESMKGAISEVFETMFFEIIDFDDAPTQTGTEYLETTIDLFRGTHALHITLMTTEPFARSLTSNFLSKKPDTVTVDDLEDLMKELANMIGGSFLARNADYDWQLQIPAFISHRSRVKEEHTGLRLANQGKHVGVVSLQNGNPSTESPNGSK